MAGDKYIYNNAGVLTEKASIQSSAGAGDAGKIASLDSTGRWDNSMMPTGIGAETASIATTEDIAAGSFVNIYVSSGVKCQKADATTGGKRAHGFVLASTTSGQNATVYLAGLNTGVTSLTAGTYYYLHTTAGGVTSTAPSGSSNGVQGIGVATSTTAIAFQPTLMYVLA